MATFEELFPGSPQSAPFEPIQQGQIDQRLVDLRARVRQAIPTGVGAEGVNSGNGQFLQAFGDLLNTPVANQKPAESPEWADYPKQLVSGIAQTGGMAAGAARYGLEQLAGARQTPGEQSLGELADEFEQLRQKADQAGLDWYKRMSPQAQNLANKKWATLDPESSIWRGGLHNTISALALQGTGALPSTLGPMIGAGTLMRMGLRLAGTVTLGASEAALTTGQVTNALHDEIKDTADETLQKESERYASLRQGGLEEDAAKAQFASEAEGSIPAIAGAMVGLIGLGVGRYLEPVFAPEGLPIGKRFVRGAISEGVFQEAPQNAIQTVAQNYAAQMYDKGRSLMQDVPEQVLQGLGLGAGLGGAGATIGGRGPRRAALPPVDETPTAETAPQGTMSFEEAFGPQVPPVGTNGWRGGDVENAALPEIDASGQRLINAGPVDQDVQAALNARQAGLIQDMFAQPQQQTPQEEQASYLQHPFPYQQQEMSLPQAGTAVIPATGTNQQLPLGITERQRGGPPQVIQPMAAQPLNEDMSAPPEASMERPMANVMPIGARPTRADFLRQRAEQMRAEQSRGMMRDENQADLFNSPESTAPTAAIEQLRNAITENAQLTKDPQLVALAQQVNPNMTRGEVTEVYSRMGKIAGINEAPAGFNQQTPDLPSAEPVSDIKAQLEDLRDPDSTRLGVYLSAANIAQMRKAGTFEQVRGVGVPLANFDEKGGTLIAKNRKAADELLAMRNSSAGDMQEILGLATGAGTGKPAGAQIAVQQRDEKGNVVRESLVATPEEADALAARFDTPSHTGVVISAAMAIRRRGLKIKEEARQAGAQRDVKQVRRQAENIIEKELGATPLAEKAKKKIGKAPLSENEAARKLVGYSARLRKQELKKHVGEVAQPEVLKFANEKQAEEYKTLFGQYRDAQIAQHMATTAEANLKAKTQIEGLRRQIGAFRRINKTTTASEEVARVARKVSPEEVQKIERAARETARSTPKTESDILGGETRTQLEQLSEADFKSMSDSELNLFFTEAANIASGSRVRRGATSKEGGTAERYATTLFTPHGKTIDEILAAYPTRSEKLKLVTRVKRMLEIRQHGGKSKTTPITSKAGTRKGAEEKFAVRKGVFSPTKALDLNPPREMSTEQSAKHALRVSEAYQGLEKGIAGVRKAIDTVMRPAFMRMARSREAENGNPPQNARDIVYGRVYLRTLFRYGQLLNQLRGRSTSALQETERYNKIVSELLAAPKDKFLSTLAKLTEAEIGEQVKTTARVDPTNLGFLSNRKRRALATLESVSRLKEQVAWSKRLHDKWHTNAYFNNFVAPLMQKLIGYTTRDAAPWNYAVERRGLGATPTLEEMQGLAFALKRFRGEAGTRIDLFDPLKRFFTEFGFKFDGQELEIPMKNGQFNYDNEATLLRKMRDRFAYSQPLTAEQRAAEVQTRQAHEAEQKFDRDEIARKRALTPEQRAAESDQPDNLNLEISDITGREPILREAATALADALEKDPLVSLNDALKTLSASLPDDHSYQPLIQRLTQLNMSDALVTWDRTGAIVGKKALAHFDDRLTDSSGRVRRVIRLNRAYFEQLRAEGFDPSARLLHAVLHESVHAAANGALANNRGLLASVRAIMQQTQRQLAAEGKKSDFYAFKNEKEFVAEAFTNRTFQRALRSVDVTRGSSAWDWIVRMVRRILGIPDTVRATNALEVTMMTSDLLFTGELRSRTRGIEAVSNLEDEPGVMSKVGNVVDKLMQSNRVTQDVQRRASNILEKNREGGSRALLSALTMEQLRDFYAKHFGGSGGPLSEYMKAFFQREADNSANLIKPTQVSQSWTASEEKNPEQALELSRLMTESSLYGIHADASLSSKLNAHVQSVQQKQRHADLSRRYQELSPDAKTVFKDTQDFYAKSVQREVALMTLNALRASVGEKGFNYTEKDVAGKNLNTLSGLESEFGDRLTPSERKVIANMAAFPQRFIGPYFPLMRFGDYVVTATRDKESKSFVDIASARAWANEQRESDPTLSVSAPVESDHGYTVNVKEEEVRMAESRSEAEQNRAEMASEYGKDAVSEVQLKSQLFGNSTAIESNRGLTAILNKLSGNAAAQAAVKDFYLRNLADKSFRKHEIRRTNRRGVDYDLQHRTFNSYAKSAAYYTSQLRFGWQMANSLADMDKYVRETAKGEHTSDLSAVRMGEVVREIDLRNKLGTDPIRVSKLIRRGTALSQFMMLTSPSYWLINSTQPYMVGIPWLAARTSLGDATAAIANAQKLIMHPILSQMGESKAGLKALWSKMSAEKAFSVLDQVEGYIKQRGGSRASEYIDMLNFLKLHNVIDLTMNSEFRDIAEGQSTGWTARVLDASRIMSHLTEVNNRIVTAVAAYDLYRNKGLSVQEATGFAQQAVSMTQFNYSSGNTPRLFSSKGPLGQAGPLVFQFMKYPQHMYALLIDNFRRAVTSGGMDRKIAIKTLAGILTTHLAAGGLLGVTLQPIKWAIGLMLAAFGDDDEPYTVANALSGETFDRLTRKGTAAMFGTDLGEILSGGLPRAAGVDVSNRMALGSLYFINLKTDTADSTLGSIVSAFGGPTVNLGLNYWQGLKYFQEGQTSKALEMALPKIGKDALRAYRYGGEGVTDGTGKPILNADQLSPWQLFNQSIGFAPSTVAERYAQRAAIKDSEQYDIQRKNALMQRFRTAKTADDRAAVLADVAEFNKKNPGAGITRSQLIKSAQSFAQASASSNQLGVNLRGKQRVYLEEGEPYNVGGDEE